jgi:hypothetical protein
MDESLHLERRKKKANWALANKAKPCEILLVLTISDLQKNSSVGAWM